jgi:hypothetical protein
MGKWTPTLSVRLDCLGARLQSIKKGGCPKKHAER